MAIAYFRCSIVKASSGKCAIASAAYQAGVKLHDDRLGRDFSYTSKEEVVFSEVLLPENAPAELIDREKLWNEVEKVSNINSRYARQIVIAIPNEWSREEAIERMHNFILSEFVQKGMAADWAFHEKRTAEEGKPDNLHVHIMLTTRRFNNDGSWEQMEKKVYALDENGEKIPEIDAATGLQKVRVRERNGYQSVEKIWKRVTIKSNEWNSRKTLNEWKHDWADYANQFVATKQIDFDFYNEHPGERLPQIHEGPEARRMLDKGIKTDAVIENEKRRKLNFQFDKFSVLVEEALKKILSFKDFFMGRKVLQNDYKSSGEKTRPVKPDYVASDRLRAADEGSNVRAGYSGSESDSSTNENFRTSIGKPELDEAHKRVSGIRERLQLLFNRNRAISKQLRAFESREQNIQELKVSVADIKLEKDDAYGRAERIKRALLGSVGEYVSEQAAGRTAGSVTAEGKGTEDGDIESIRSEIENLTGSIRDKIAAFRAGEAVRRTPGNADGAKGEKPDTEKEAKRIRH